MVRALLLWALLTASLFGNETTESVVNDGPFETSISWTPIDFKVAKAASIEQLNQAVAIFMIEPEAGSRLGVELTITTKAEVIIVEVRKVFGRVVPARQRANGNYYFTGDPGEYEVGVFQFLDKKAHKTTVDKIFIGPVKPVEPDLPPGNDFANLAKVVSEKAKALNDPATAQQLSKAYNDALAASVGKSREEVVATVRAYRGNVFRSRPDSSLKNNWNTFLLEVDTELKKVGQTLEGYRNAIAIISKALLISP